MAASVPAFRFSLANAGKMPALLGGRLAHLAMGCARVAASVAAFRFSLANAGKMPALLEAGAFRMLASRRASLDGQAVEPEAQGGAAPGIER
jgi:hypothetical protein